MKIVTINSALKRLKQLNEEIRYADCLATRRFTGGLIAFRPHRRSDPKQINHSDKDVVCHVIKGSGRLRVDGKRTPLKPGMVCHIPKGTPHDFAAGRNRELVLFYLLIKTG